MNVNPNDEIIEALDAESRFIETLNQRELPELTRRKGPSAPRKPRISLPGDDHTLGDQSAVIGSVLGKHECLSRSDELVIWDENLSRLRAISPECFRTFAEKYVAFYDYNFKGDKVDRSLTLDMARAVLASFQFHGQLPRLLRVNPCPQPVRREDGRLTLLTPGYDDLSETLTVGGIDSLEEIPLNLAVQILRGLFSEFQFLDREQGISVAIAMMVGLFVGTVLGPQVLRPALVVVANAEGAGKTLLVKIIVQTILGTVPIGVRPDREEEMEKQLLTIVREAKPVLFLDNVSGTLSSARLEAFLTAEVWSGRILGRSESFTGPNLATVFITGNGLRVTPDLRRRSLFVELQMQAERAEDRVFKQRIDDSVISERRPMHLACLWALVRHWDTLQRPGPTRGHSAFCAWADVVGGIVEAAGFKCPFETPPLSNPVDPEADDMGRLVGALVADTKYEFSSLVARMRDVGAFERIVGIAETDDNGFQINQYQRLTAAEASRLGIKLAKYNGRPIGGWRFIVEGTGHAKRFYKTALVG